MQRHTSSSSTAQQSDSRNQTSRQTRHSSVSYPFENAQGHNAQPQEAVAGDGQTIVLFSEFTTMFFLNLVGLTASSASCVYRVSSSSLTFYS